ncbi:MAG: helix-turn-helix transcriptional regulator [candidate division WS1 bacterium]|nr:helix-turn-helix transcriptional regulator [candidate division WS1 bacterium]
MPRDAAEPLYVISVAARLVDCHPQTLRTYERMGLISPRRSSSNVRLYSDHDIERLRQIQRLTQEMGVNLAGVEVILRLLERVEMLESQIERLERDVKHGPRRLNPPATVVTQVRIIGSSSDE